MHSKVPKDASNFTFSYSTKNDGSYLKDADKVLTREQFIKKLKSVPKQKGAVAGFVSYEQPIASLNREDLAYRMKYHDVRNKGLKRLIKGKTSYPYKGKTEGKSKEDLLNMLKQGVFKNMERSRRLKNIKEIRRQVAEADAIQKSIKPGASKEDILRSAGLISDKRIAARQVSREADKYQLDRMRSMRKNIMASMPKTAQMPPIPDVIKSPEVKALSTPGAIKINTKNNLQPGTVNPVSQIAKLQQAGDNQKLLEASKIPNL